MPKTTKKHLSVMVTADDLRFLQSNADRQGLTLSFIVRRAIAQYIKRYRV